MTLNATFSETAHNMSLNRAFWGHESSLTSSDDAGFENVIKNKKNRILTIIHNKRKLGLIITVLAG